MFCGIPYSRRLIWRMYWFSVMRDIRNAIKTEGIERISNSLITSYHKIGAYYPPLASGTISWHGAPGSTLSNFHHLGGTLRV